MSAGTAPGEIFFIKIKDIFSAFEFYKWISDYESNVQLKVELFRMESQFWIMFHFCPRIMSNASTHSGKPF